MSERRPGVPRLRHGVGVGVGHFCAEGTVHGPIVSRSHASWTQNFGKKKNGHVLPFAETPPLLPHLHQVYRGKPPLYRW
jgi:hypothetical protein